MALPMKVMKSTAAMKAMKAMKATKAMKSKVARGPRRKSVVFSGKKEKTSGGLTKAELTKNMRGKVVSKKKSAAGKKAYKYISGWTKAVQQSRKELGIKGFCAIGGKSAQGRALYAKAKSLLATQA
eukprot:TRINITY_DN505_c1_g1_i1.p2 TRINITY_DN505_c1_g1~~TRINITY_DN505_c1_g1_i1.p2  ORF type:complete len:126 (+),score=43.30 TRINITY_DN505_c1_g1_i1:3-380(+)